MDPEEYKAVRIAIDEVKNIRREMLQRSCRDLSEETQLYVSFSLNFILINSFLNWINSFCE